MNRLIIHLSDWFTVGSQTTSKRPCSVFLVANGCDEKMAEGK